MAKEQFSLIDQSTAIGTLLDGIDYKIPIHSGTTKILCQSNITSEMQPGLPQVT